MHAWAQSLLASLTDRVLLLGGVNKYGYMLSCMLVIDDYMSGIPGAFMISSSEAAEEQLALVGTAGCRSNATAC